MQFSAVFFDGNNSKPHNVIVVVTDDDHLIITGLDSTKTYSWNEIEVSQQLGSMPRFLIFPDGSKCETNEHEIINKLLAASNRDKGSQWLHNLESKIKYVALATIFVTGFTVFMLTYGIPAMASKVAYAIPPSVDKHLAKGSMEILDNIYMEPSELDKETQQRLINKFNAMAEIVGGSHEYKLHFRHSHILGANAFALPSGDIVMTDQLVELANNDQEILTIFAHEIGHVVHRHSMRSVLQNSAVYLVMIAVTGDIFSSSAFSAALPLLLIETKFSREFEVEADQFSYDYLVENGIETYHFSNILTRITGADENDAESMFKYLSTHPMTKERVKMFKHENAKEPVSSDVKKQN